jgi:hypothetical protein
MGAYEHDEGIASPATLKSKVPQVAHIPVVVRTDWAGSFRLSCLLREPGFNLLEDLPRGGARGR